MSAIEKLNLELIDAAMGGDTAAVQALIERGADVNARIKENGQTVLLLSIIRGHTNTVKELLDKGADINARDKDGYTALMWATGIGHDQIVELLQNARAKR